MSMFCHQCEQMAQGIGDVNFDEAEQVEDINQELTPALAKARDCYLDAYRRDSVEPEKIFDPAEFKRLKTAKS